MLKLKTLNSLMIVFAASIAFASFANTLEKVPPAKPLAPPAGLPAPKPVPQDAARVKTEDAARPNWDGQKIDVNRDAVSPFDTRGLKGRRTDEKSR